VRALVLRPSRDLSGVAAEHEWRLPRALRFLLRGLGTDERRSADLLSMILFEPPFIRRLLELGESDTEERGGAYDAFLDA
jgi:NTE family protein